MSPNSPAPSALSGFGSTAGAGTLAGEATAGNAPDLRSNYAREFEQSYGAESKLDETSPAYLYGYNNASEERYRGRSWEDVESELRLDYERNNPGSTWDQAKGAVRSGWDKYADQR
jgi:hypothetical protein